MKERKKPDIYIVEMHFEDNVSMVYGVTDNESTARRAVTKAAVHVVETYLESHHCSEISRNGAVGKRLLLPSKLKVYAQLEPDGGFFDQLRLYCTIEMWSLPQMPSTGMQADLND